MTIFAASPRSYVDFNDAAPQKKAHALDPRDLLADECRLVASMAKGERGAALNRAAFGLAYHVARRNLRSDQVTEALLKAAEDNGLVAANGRKDCLRTIERALMAGEQRAGIGGRVPRLDARAAAEAAARNAERRRQEEDRLRKAAAFCDGLWQGAIAAAGGPVDAYLRSRALGPAPAVLRYHSAVPQGYESLRTAPAMLAAVQDRKGLATGLHATPIRADGSKDPNCIRLMFGSVGGGAVRLAEHGDELAVAEGIETALSFQKLFGTPTWAVLSTSGLRRFVPPAGLRRLIIAADRDDTGDGMKAAHALANASKSLCEVIIAAAPEGQDWNDALRGQQ